MEEGRWSGGGAEQRNRTGAGGPNLQESGGREKSRQREPDWSGCRVSAFTRCLQARPSACHCGHSTGIRVSLQGPLQMSLS